MKVRRESVQTRSETDTRRPGTGSAICGGACLAPPGTGTKKKGASPQQYVEELNGETGRRNRVFALVADAS